MKFKEIEIGKSEQIRALLTGIEERGAKAGTRYLVLNFTVRMPEVMDSGTVTTV